MLAVLTTHPIQYQTPIWRGLAARDDVPFTVMFMSDQGLKARFDPGFGRELALNIDLLDGYPHEFLPVRTGPKQDAFGWLKLQPGRPALWWRRIDHGAAEGGLGKPTMDLGVPGLMIAIWFAYALGRYMWRVLGQLAVTSQAHARVGYGMVAFMASNVAAFSVAAQAYGDVFILLCLGWALSFLLALPVLAHRAVLAAQRPVVAAPVSGFATLRR